MTGPLQPEEPRARLLRAGAEALTDAELLAVLLSPCGDASEPCPETDPDPAAMLEALGGLPGLPTVTRHHFQARGLDPDRATPLLAAVELARRMAAKELPERVTLRCLADVVGYLRLHTSLMDQEVVGALFTDHRRGILGHEVVFRGTYNRSVADPVPILKAALLRSARGLVLFHTHTSTDPTPSAEDMLFTDQLREAAKALGLEMIDHLVFSPHGRWISIKNYGLGL